MRPLSTAMALFLGLVLGLCSAALPPAPGQGITKPSRSPLLHSGRMTEAPPGSRPDDGVVYYIPGDDVSDDAVVQQLQPIKSQGYRHINLSLWVWTLPKPGSSLRRRVEVILDWCDSHDLGVWLLHNIQYGTSEYGDWEEAVKDPAAYVRPVVVDWIDVLRGHHCVRGVQLGNEVGPAIPPDAAKAPLYTLPLGSPNREILLQIRQPQSALGLFCGRMIG